MSFLTKLGKVAQITIRNSRVHRYNPYVMEVEEAKRMIRSYPFFGPIETQTVHKFKFSSLREVKEVVEELNNKNIRYKVSDSLRYELEME